MMNEFNFFHKLGEMLPATVASANKQLADEAVDNIRAHIIANGQIESGNMLDSVHAETQSDGTQNVVVDCVNEQGEYYAAYPNYGTVNQAANPFFEPGLQDTQEAMDDALQAIIHAWAEAIR